MTLTDDVKPMTLIPYFAQEAIDLKAAGIVAGRAPSTIRLWCLERHIGRRIVAGQWYVSKIALAMLLDGDLAALDDYHNGDRYGPRVTPYIQRCGLQDIFKEPKS